MKLEFKKLFLVPSIGLLVTTSALLSGCTLGPDYVRPELYMTQQYQDAAANQQQIANISWWELYEDPVLQSLIRTALEQNKDLKVAAARIDASRALLGITRADQFPRIDGGAAAERFDNGDELGLPISGPTNNYGLLGNLSFEIDLWGKLRNATQAQRAELLASEYGYRTVTVTLVSQVASAYFNILGVKYRLEVARTTLANRKDATALIKARFDGGVVPELDVNQAQIEEADAAVSVASFERALRIAENALAVLLGRSSLQLPVGQPLRKQQLQQDIPTGFPAELLERRPDVLAAEEQVKAAVARVGVAEALQYPSLDLLGFVGFRSNNTSNLFSSNAFSWGVGGNLLGPILDWGQTAAGVDFAQAQAVAAYAQYEQSVNVAVQEVEDAIVSIRTFKDEYNSRVAQVSAARNAARLSRARYDDGVTSYLEVLDVERSLFDAEIGEISALENHLISIVQLYRALGGGWNEVTELPKHVGGNTVTQP